MYVCVMSGYFGFFVCMCVFALGYSFTNVCVWLLVFMNAHTFVCVDILIHSTPLHIPANQVRWFSALIWTFKEVTRCLRVLCRRWAGCPHSQHFINALEACQQCVRGMYFKQHNLHIVVAATQTLDFKWISGMKTHFTHLKTSDS